MSLQQFETLFPDEDACARHLVKLRWGDGFVCPGCGGTKGWEFKGDRCRRECADCGRQTSVTAGTVMHRTHLPLKTRFLATHIVATRSNGIPALQLQAQLGIGSDKSALLLLQKLPRAMIDPDRSVVRESVEVDEASMPFREGRGAQGRSKKGRSAEGKMLLAGAVELSRGWKAPPHPVEGEKRLQCRLASGLHRRHRRTRGAGRHRRLEWILRSAREPARGQGDR